LRKRSGGSPHRIRSIVPCRGAWPAVPFREPHEGLFPSGLRSLFPVALVFFPSNQAEASPVNGRVSRAPATFLTWASLVAWHSFFLWSGNPCECAAGEKVIRVPHHTQVSQRKGPLTGPRSTLLESAFTTLGLLYRCVVLWKGWSFVCLSVRPVSRSRSSGVFMRTLSVSLLRGCVIMSHAPSATLLVHAVRWGLSRLFWSFVPVAGFHSPDFL